MRDYDAKMPGYFDGTMPGDYRAPGRPRNSSRLHQTDAPNALAFTSDFDRDNSMQSTDYTSVVLSAADGVVY